MDSNGLELPALTPPAPVAAIAPQEAANRVPLPAEETTRLDGQVGQFIGDLTTLDPHGSEFKTRVDAILALGDGDVRASASVANRMLERPMKAMKNGVYDAASPVSKALGDLRNQVEALDPSKQGDLLSPRKLLGMIPFGNKLTAYFDGYRSAQNHLNAIIETLYRSKDELQRDNASIEQEKAAMWALLQKLEGVEIPARYGPPRAGDVHDSQADTTLAVRDLGHAPRFSFEEGMRRTLEWYRTQ